MVNRTSVLLIKYQIVIIIKLLLKSKLTYLILKNT